MGFHMTSKRRSRWRESFSLVWVFIFRLLFWISRVYKLFFFFWIFRGVSIFNSWRLTIQIIKLLTWKIKTQLNIELAIKKFQLTKVKIGWKWISRQKKLPRFSNYLYSSQIPDKYATCCLPLKKKKAQAPSLGFLFFYFKVCTPHLTFYYYYYLFICSFFFMGIYIYI